MSDLSDLTVEGVVVALVLGALGSMLGHFTLRMMKEHWFWTVAFPCLLGVGLTIAVIRSSDLVFWLFMGALLVVSGWLKWRIVQRERR